jgi:hypothetical protein
MRLTHWQRRIFRMLANARRSSGRQGMPGPLLLSKVDRKLAARLGEIGDDGPGPLRWPAKEQRDLTASECHAGLALLESDAAQRWLPKWTRGDPEGRAKIATLIVALHQGTSSEP